jgi:hypothetical protein
VRAARFRGLVPASVGLAGPEEAALSPCGGFVCSPIAAADEAEEGCAADSGLRVDSVLAFACGLGFRRLDVPAVLLSDSPPVKFASEHECCGDKACGENEGPTEKAEGGRGVQ